MIFTGSQKVRIDILALFLMFPFQAWPLFYWFRWQPLDLTQKRKLIRWCLSGSSFMLGLLSWQSLIWNVGSQRWDPLINYRGIITAAFPGQALTCFEAGLPAPFILSPWNLPLSWVLISLTHSSVLPLGPCWFDFRISPFSSYSVTGVQKVVSTGVTLHVLGG